MYKLIWIIIVFCLLMGVVLLGAKIYNKSNEIEIGFAEKNTQVGDKIAELKKVAIKKKLAMQKAFRGTKTTLDKRGVNQKKHQPKKNEKKETNPSPTKIRIPINTVPLNPLDEEDRKLTGELLSEAQDHKESSKETVQTVEKQSSVSILENNVPAKEHKEPMDLNRLTEIRDLYLKAIETLDWN